MSLSHYLISFLLAYLVGSIPFGYVVGRLFFHKNLLTLGSGNIGTTNTARVLGWRIGLVVMCLDILKGSLGALMACLWGPLTVSQHWLYFAVGLGAILGHTYSFWIGFRGGKAVATSVGVLLIYNPLMFCLAFAIFGSTLFITSMVSVASMVGFTLITLASALIQDWFLTLIAFSLTLFVFYRHRENIHRLKTGHERLIPFGLNYWRHQS